MNLFMICILVLEAFLGNAFRLWECPTDSVLWLLVRASSVWWLKLLSYWLSLLIWC